MTFYSLCFFSLFVVSTGCKQRASQDALKKTQNSGTISSVSRHYWPVKTEAGIFICRGICSGFRSGMTQIELREVCRGDLRAVDISSFSQASGSDSGPLFVSSTMSDMFYPPEVFSPNEGSSSEWRADANIIPKLEKRFEISVSGEESESSRKNGYSFCLSENDEIASNSSGFSVTSNGSAWGPSGLEWIDDDFSIPNTPLDSSERCVDLVKKGRVVALPAILQKFQSTYGFKSCKLEEFNTTGNLSSSLFGCRYNLTCKGWGDVYGDYPVRMARGSCSQFNKKLKDKCLFDVKTSTGTMSVIQVYRYSINVK